MVQEVRSILFTADECRTAVTTLLVTRVRGLRPEQVIKVELADAATSARATLRMTKAAETSHVLSADDLMSAVLLFCRRSQIPLSTRSHKRLALVAGCLALTTTINLRPAARAAAGSTSVQTLSGPDLAMLHSV